MGGLQETTTTKNLSQLLIVLLHRLCALLSHLHDIISNQLAGAVLIQGRQANQKNTEFEPVERFYEDTSVRLS